MKINFDNFGPIEKAEIEIRPLTIFVGPNNAGKTWTAYALASIFGPSALLSYADAYIQRSVPNIYEALENAIEQTIKQGATTFDLVQFADDYEGTYFNELAHYLQDSIADFLSTELATFKNFHVSIELGETKARVLERILHLELSREVIGTEESPILSIRKASGDRRVVIYSSPSTFPEDTNVEGIPPILIRDFLVKAILEVIHREIYPFVRILPTERTTFIAHPSGYRPVEEDENLNQDTSSQEKVKLAPGSVGYFLSMMKTISELSGKKQRATKNDQIKKYRQLAELLENQILGGKLKYSQLHSTQYQDTEVLFQLPTGRQIEVSVASSMVKELSSLLFYLRYLARPRELIIIDEPEMNLHPEAQVKLIEFLSILVNANINVLITTHSPYLIDHLANLIKANDSENKEIIKEEFYLKRTDAFISRDQVSVYLFDHGQARNAIDDEGVIDLNTFGQVADRISEIYFTL
ncbi:MAG TPA: AAA family ATPase [Ktedonobacteraceae bacterium]|nr:AAA family ATPase [Ktedonobacteraceae bacterium]